MSFVYRFSTLRTASDRCCVICAFPETCNGSKNRRLVGVKDATEIVSGGRPLWCAAAYFMFKHLKNAQLVLYPDSGHGALF